MHEINFVVYENRHPLCYYDESLKSCFDPLFQNNRFLRFFQDFRDAQKPVRPLLWDPGPQKFP